MAETLTKAGRYHIVGELGRGSMGIVYQGFDPVIGRTVAIKTMIPEGLSPQEFEEYKARFQREAMAAGVLAHPNIITVYDFGEDNGLLYLALEYLEGKSLEQIVQEQSVLPIEAILPIYDQVCSALDHAHQNMIIHRDIKPANIMILQNGLVKVTDFGIAKMINMGMTQAGQILGTPNYMSPEQVKGRQIDGRSDIFSLGVILYELVTGEKPFGGENITTVIYKIINENPIPPRDLDVSIHGGLSYVISKALAKNPDERYQTCRQLAEDLRNYKNLGSAEVAAAPAIAEPVAAPIAAPKATPLPPPPAPVVVDNVEISQLIPPTPPPPVIPRAKKPVAKSFDETPIGGSFDEPVVPLPPPPREQSVPQFAWVLGALLILGITAGIGFLIVRQKHRAEVPITESVPAPPVTPAPVNPVTPAPEPVAPSAAPAPAPPAAPGVNAPEHPAPVPTPTPAAGKGELAVTANVKGAKISVDGRSDPKWVTPYTIADLPAGTHNIEISIDGYESFQQSVSIPAGQSASVEGNLSAPSAEFTINTKPAGVEVFIDGKSYGPSPVRASLPPGLHTYKVIQPGGTPYENTVNLKSGNIITKTLTLGVVAANGVVEIRTTPPGATVTADGTPVSGQTPISCRLSVGSHTLVISLSGFRQVEQQVTVAENATANVNVTLTSQ
jgi:serine/threonine protein kinase